LQIAKTCGFPLLEIFDFYFDFFGFFLQICQLGQGFEKRENYLSFNMMGDNGKFLKE